MHRVYMDANATTPLLSEVFAAMRPYYEAQFGNASYDDGVSATIGLQGASTSAIQFSCNTASLMPADVSSSR